MRSGGAFTLDRNRRGRLPQTRRGEEIEMLGKAVQGAGHEGIAGAGDITRFRGKAGIVLLAVAS